MTDAPKIDALPDKPETAGGPSRGWSFRLAVALLLAACVYFAVRGPWRAMTDPSGGNNLRVYYCASRAWMQGLNPYDQAELDQINQQAGGGATRVDTSINFPPCLPPMTIVGCIDDWQTAKVVWLSLSVLLTGVCLWQLCVLLGLKRSDPRTLLLWAFGLALAPLHTDICEGQLSIFVTTLLVLALRCQGEKQPKMAGMLLGVALAVKPFMVVLLPVMLLFRGQWRALIYTVFAFALLTGLAVGRMNASDVAWLPAMQHNLQGFAQGGRGDPAGPLSYRMINLHVVLSGIVKDPTMVWAMVGALVAAIGGAGLLAMRRLRDMRSELLLWGLFVVLCLAGGYNRFYGAAMLLLPLAWAFASLREPGLRRVSWAVLLLIAPFLVPGTAALAEWVGADRLRATPGGGLLLYHQVFLLAILAITLALAAVRSGVRRSSGNADLLSTAD